MERRDETGFDPFAAFDLSGKVAIVTGAASGIGEAAVRTFAAAGAAVMLADVDEVGTQRVLDDLRREGARASSLRVDTRVRGDLDEVVDRTVAEFGSLDILANVAGVGSYGLIEDADEAEVDRAFAINFKGPLFGCQACLAGDAAPGLGLDHQRIGYRDQHARGRGRHLRRDQSRRGDAHADAGRRSRAGRRAGQHDRPGVHGDELCRRPSA